MEKRISVNEFRSAVRVAQACDPYIRKREAVAKKIAALQEEYDTHQTMIDSLEAGVVKVVGFNVESLVKKVIETKTDASGKEVKTTKYVPADNVTYDEIKKQYVVYMQGSDNDIDNPDPVVAESESKGTPVAEDTYNVPEAEVEQPVDTKEIPAEAPQVEEEEEEEFPIGDTDSEDSEDNDQNFTTPDWEERMKNL